MFPFGASGNATAGAKSPTNSLRIPLSSPGAPSTSNQHSLAHAASSPSASAMRTQRPGASTSLARPHSTNLLSPNQTVGFASPLHSPMHSPRSARGPSSALRKFTKAASGGSSAAAAGARSPSNPGTPNNSSSTTNKKKAPKGPTRNHAPSDIPLTEIHSSPSLQVILFFNIVYSFCYFVFNITSFIVRSLNGNLSLSTIALVVHIALLIITVGAEFLRLIAGFTGNLRERVPRLAAFMVISLIMLPLQLGYFVIGGSRDISLLERVSAIILLLFLIFEVVFGSRAIWIIVGVSSRKYHLQFNADGSLYEDAEDGMLDLDNPIYDEVETMERPSTAMSFERPGTAMSSERPGTAASTEGGTSRPSSRSGILSPNNAGSRFFSGFSPSNTGGATGRSPFASPSGSGMSTRLEDRLRELKRRNHGGNTASGSSPGFTFEVPSPPKRED